MAEIINREARTVPVEDLRPHPDNPRDGDIGAIWDSIEQNGFYGAVVVQESSGHILAGNHRYLAAQEAGLEEVPAIYVDVSDEEAMRIMLADNRTNDLAGYNDSELADLLSHLDSTDDGLTGTGWDEDAMDELIDELDQAGLNGEGAEDPGAEIDRAEELREEWGTERGQLWKIGDHRLLCGDSTDEGDVGRLMDGEKASLVVTDPPYNINYGNIKHPEFKVREIENDDMSGSEFRAFCEAFAGRIEENTEGCIYVFGPPGPDGRIMFTVLDEVFNCSTTVIWNKDQFTLGRSKYQNKYEPCWFGWKGSGKRFTDDRSLVNVWDVPRPQVSEEHPTMKPVELIERPIKHASRPGDVVLDLFIGSGTTVVAAERQGRTCYAMELEPKYVAVTLQRLADMGLEPELVS